jgi:hypothetical protein
MPDVDTDMVREVARLKKRKREISAENREIGKRLEVLVPRLLDQYEAAQTKSVRTNEGLVYLTRKGWARIIRDDPDRKEITDEERQRALDALRRAGLERYLKEDYNTQSLSAYLRELIENGEELPPELKGAISFETEWDLGVKG